MNPSQIRSSQQKVYEALRSWQTRVIRLHSGELGQDLSCDLLVADLIYFDGVAVHDGEHIFQVQYDALSYVRGSPDMESRLRCNGTEVQITNSLSSALRHQRYRENSRYLWVDALCIHQGDNAEKSAQVRNMMVIYRKAERVTAWLGQGQENLTDFFDLCNEASSEEELSSDLSLKIQQGLQRFSELPYFHRVWVQQEAYVANKLVFHCECGSIDLATIQCASMRCRQVRSSKLAISFQSPGLFNLSPEPIQEKVPQLPVIGSGTSEPRKAVDLLEALCIASSLQASNPLDEIYAVLGVTSTPTTVARQQDDIERGPRDAAAELPSVLIEYDANLEDA